jgi:pilus assembly protein Flp/PilA
MKQLKRWAEATRVNAMLNDDGGAALVEYGLLVGLIAVVCIGAVTATGLTVKSLFCDVVDAGLGAIPGVVPGAGC